MIKSANFSRALLEVTTTKLATSIESVDDYIQKTLLYHTMNHTGLAKMVESTLEDLEQTELSKKDTDGIFQVTLLG